MRLSPVSCELRAANSVLARGHAGVPVAAQKHAHERTLLRETGGRQPGQPRGIEARDVDGEHAAVEARESVAGEMARGLGVGRDHRAELAVEIAGASEAIA